MVEIVSATVERWPVDGAFIISRGAKTHVDVIVCTVGDGTHVGRGEGTAIYYEGETAEDCAVAITAYRGPMDRDSVNRGMDSGAARNALDCALWDYEAKRTGVPVWQRAGLHAPVAVPTAFTISLNDPAQMEKDAQTAATRGFALLKCKLTGEGDRDRIAAVRRGAPHVRLIVDANESWAEMDVAAEACWAACSAHRWALRPHSLRHRARIGWIWTVRYCSPRTGTARWQCATGCCCRGRCGVKPV